VGLAKGLWRMANDKDLKKMIGYAPKMYEKKLKSELDFDYGQSGPDVNKYYIYSQFEKVDDGVPSKGWKRAFIQPYKYDTCRLILINLSKKQWKYDISYNGDRMALFWAGNAVKNSEWSEKYPLSNEYYNSIINTCELGDYDGSENWIAVKFDNKKTLYINLHTLEYSGEVKNNNTKSIEDQLKELDNSRWPNSSISDELADYIKKEFKNAPDNDTKGKWIKVHRAGSDSKYGSFMINIERKLRRDTNFDEFYGGGIVD
jgi:hypothetical protein